MKGSGSARRLAATVLAVAAALMVIVALLTGYSQRALFDSEQFADRASSALADDAVANELGLRAADGLVEANPNLVAVRPVLEEVLAGVVASGAFNKVFRAGVRDVHRAIFEQDLSTATLTIADIGATARGAISALNPKLAKKIPSRSAADVLVTDPPPILLTLGQAAENLAPLPWIALAMALILFAAALLISGDRRRTALALGITLT